MPVAVDVPEGERVVQVAGLQHDDRRGREPTAPVSEEDLDGVPPPVGGDDVQIPASAGPDHVFAIFCPNCGFRLPRSSPDDPANDATDPAVRYGDRILVLKYLYLLQDPKRWDVVVFKSPVAPAQSDYTVNYIKRLVGRPGANTGPCFGEERP